MENALKGEPSPPTLNTDSTSNNFSSVASISLTLNVQRTNTRSKRKPRGQNRHKAHIRAHKFHNKYYYWHKIIVGIIGSIHNEATLHQDDDTMCGKVVTPSTVLSLDPTPNMQPGQRWRSVINVRGSRTPLSLLQSSFLPFPLVDSPVGLGRARSPAAKHFDAIYTVKQPY